MINSELTEPSITFNEEIIQKEKKCLKFKIFIISICIGSLCGMIIIIIKNSYYNK